MVSRSRARRRGFTLIELLVVVAIIAVLMALLLPAVQKVREAANKITCGKNLNQAAMGFHMFHHDFNRFPSGGWLGQITVSSTGGGTTTRLSPPGQTAGWAFQILPYIEQKQVYDMTVNGTGAAGQLGAQIPIYFCPSRRAPTLLTSQRGGIDYAGCFPQAAFVNNAATFHNTNGANPAGLVVPTTGTASTNDNRVILNQGSIPTGSSNVVLIAEKYINQINYAGGTVGDNDGYACGWPNGNTSRVDTMRTAGSTITPQMDSSATNYTNNAILGSAHPSTFQVVMGDRTVKQLRYSITQVQMIQITNRKNATAIDWSTIE